MARGGTGILIIHMHEYFLGKIPLEKRQSLLLNQQSILTYASAADIPTAAIHYHGYGAIEPTLHQTYSKIKRNWSLTTDSIDPFKDTNLDLIFRAHKIQNILVMGVLTSGCVAGAVAAARERQYTVLTSPLLMANETAEEMHVAAFQKQREQWVAEHTVQLTTLADVIKQLS